MSRVVDVVVGGSGVESIGPELRQYLVAGNNEERPSLATSDDGCTRRRRRRTTASGFGTDNDIEYTAGYPVIKHRIFGRAIPAVVPRRRGRG